MHYSKIISLQDDGVNKSFSLKLEGMNISFKALNSYVEPKNLFKVFVKELIEYVNKMYYSRTCPYKFVHEIVNGKNVAYIQFAEKRGEYYEVKTKELLQYSWNGKLGNFNGFILDYFDYIVMHYNFLEKDYNPFNHDRYLLTKDVHSIKYSYVELKTKAKLEQEGFIFP